MRAVEDRRRRRAAGSSGSPSRSPTSEHSLPPALAASCSSRSRSASDSPSSPVLALPASLCASASGVSVAVGASVAAGADSTVVSSSPPHAGDDQREHGEQQCGQCGRTNSHANPLQDPRFLAIMTDRCSDGTDRPHAPHRALTGCGGDGDTVPVVVSAPVSTEPWIAASIERGARLAVDEINADGGVQLKDGQEAARSSSCSTTPPRPRPRWPTRARRSTATPPCCSPTAPARRRVAVVTDPREAAGVHRSSRAAPS